MKNMIIFSLIVISHISLFGQTPCGQEKVVSFTNLGSFITPMLDSPTISADLVITASADINVLNLNGLGVVGGLFDNSIDYFSSESMTFDFQNNSGNSGNAYYISYYIAAAGQSVPTNAFSGEHTLEAFDRDGVSMGVVEMNGSGIKDVSGLFENISISKIIVTAINTDNFRIGSITYSMECVQVLPYSIHAETGHVYIDNMEGGLIFKSPNGDCWFMSVDNNGNMTSNKIDCSN